MCVAAKHFLPTAEHDQSHAQPCRLRRLPAASMQLTAAGGWDKVRAM
jgi:hypothetical protein